MAKHCASFIGALNRSMFILTISKSNVLCSRTSLHWTNEVVVKWNAQVFDLFTSPHNTYLCCIFQEGVLSEKEIKRYAFQLAESRYQELLPLLSRLNELENSQKDEEGRFSRKHRRGDQKAI